MKIGTRVKIERDEQKYPPTGTWHWFSGRSGTVVQVNRAGGGSTEYGVCFGAVTLAEESGNRTLDWESDQVVWFLRHEMRPLRTQPFINA